MRTLLLLASCLTLAATPSTDRCVDGLSQEIGRRPPAELVEVILREVGTADSGLVLSLIAVESAFNPAAISTAGAMGLMQVTEAAMIDAAAWCQLPRVALSQLYVPAINVRYGSCYLRLWIELTGSETNALVGYNGGYRQWNNLRAGRPLATETANYVVKVRRYRDTYCSVR